MPAIEDQGDVNVDDIAVAEGLSIGKAMADDVVQRRADRFAVATVIERRRVGPMRHGELEHQIVESFGTSARLNVARKHIKGLRGEQSSLPHASEGILAMNLDLACFAARRF